MVSLRPEKHATRKYRPLGRIIGNPQSRNGSTKGRSPGKPDYRPSSYWNALPGILTLQCAAFPGRHKNARVAGPGVVTTVVMVLDGYKLASAAITALPAISSVGCV